MSIELDPQTAPWYRINALDDVIVGLGNDKDGVLVLDSAGLTADTALAGVLIGTPVTPVLPANSVIISNITASGDILIAANRGGNSEAYVHIDSSAGVLYLTPVQGGLMVGLAADAPAPDGATVHIWAATAGAVTANAAALLVLETSSNTQYLQFLGPSTTIAAGLLFSNPGNDSIGSFVYDRANDRWITSMTGANKLLYSPGAFAFQEATAISTSAGALTLNPTTTVIIPDDKLFTLGTDGDGVLLNVSAGLAANTALTGVLIGTPVAYALAANSIVLANVTAAGDMGFAVNNGGHSQLFIHMDTSTGELNLRPSVVIAARSDIQPYGNILFQTSTSIMQAPNSNNAYVQIKAKTNSGSMTEIERWAGAAIPYVSHGASQENKFYSSGLAEFGGEVELTTAHGITDAAHPHAIARGTYDFAVSGGATSTIGLGVTIPDNAIVIKAWYEVITTLTSATGPDNATVSLDIPTDDAAGLLAAIAINNGANPWDAGHHACIQDGTVANFANKCTAARELSMTIAVDALTAGKFILWAEYIVSD